MGIGSYSDGVKQFRCCTRRAGIFTAENNLELTSDSRKAPLLAEAKDWMQTLSETSNMVETCFDSKMGTYLPTGPQE